MQPQKNDPIKIESKEPRILGRWADQGLQRVSEPKHFMQLCSCEVIKEKGNRWRGKVRFEGWKRNQDWKTEYHWCSACSHNES